MANTRVQQTTLINTNLADNTSGLITPAKDREVELASVAASAFVDDDNDFTGVNVHTKEVRWHKGVNLASATNVALGVTGNYHHITGAVEIETLSTKQHGTRMLLYFVSNPNLKQSANLLLGGADITVVAGSNAEFISEGSGVWRLIKYNNGAISGDWVPTITVDGSGITAANLVSASISYTGNIGICSLFFDGIVSDFAAYNEGFIQIAGTEFPIAPIGGQVVSGQFYQPVLVGIKATSSTNLRINLNDPTGTVNLGSSELSIVCQFQV